MEAVPWWGSGYYLFTGKREASLTEFIRDGKISSGKPQEPEAK